MSTPLVSDALTAMTAFPAPVAAAFSLTILGGFALGKLKARQRAQDAAIAAASPPSLPRELLLPVVHQDPDHIARAEVVARVSTLVLDGDWGEVTAEIGTWEARLEATPAGTRYHDIAIETCLAPLQNLIDEAPRDTISDLEGADVAALRMAALLNAAPNDHILAAIAARAHVLIAETCRAEFWPETQRDAALRHMAHHHMAAEAILNRFDPVAYMSPLLGGTAYRLAAGMPDAAARLEHVFEDWIDLDPSDPAIYVRHAEALAAREDVPVADLLREAANAEARTEETLGQAGYALFAVPMLEMDDSLRVAFSPERLAAGLMDLARHSGTQAEVNWAAACLAKESSHGPEPRRQIMTSAFEALVRRHLGVLYPRLWDLPLDQIRAKLKTVFEGEPVTAPDEASSLRPISVPRAAA